MNKTTLLKLALAVVLLGGAGFLFARFLKQDRGVGEQEYFYDLSEQKLFAAPRESLPPIRGINDAAEDGVRAVVIASGNNPDNKAARRIAYLEKYAPELKQHLEKVRAGEAEPLPTKVRNGYRLVKRVEDETWHPLNTPQGEKILTEWNVAGPDGAYPVVCSP
ncbi:MAG TPA: hypothetical protein PKN95_09505 [Verrucomicrobiota bacterium]|nr:hypothetical protein [Verrucomicrobiota bacterium]HNT16163.1 hypothetical protein [Verrucomicrobiota bacterium]